MGSKISKEEQAVLDGVRLDGEVRTWEEHEDPTALAIDTDGNLGIAGHRDGFFRGLKDIEVGDSIEMLTHQGNSEFVVSSITIVDPTDVSVLAPTDSSTITLVTCYPFYFVGHAPKRYIVKGELVSNQVSQS